MIIRDFYIVYFCMIYLMLNLPRFPKACLSFISFQEESLKKTILREKKIVLAFYDFCNLDT